MKKTLIAPLTLSAALFSAGSMAQPPMGPSIEMFDQDKSGTVTAEEFNQARAARMAEMAKQGRPMRHAGQAPQFGDLDADGDGELTADELANARPMHRMGPPPMMPRMGDGRMPRMGDGMMPRHGKRGGCMHKGIDAGKPMGMHRGMGMHKGMRGKRHSFSDLDLDNDGMISPAEFDAHHARMMGE